MTWYVAVLLSALVGMSYLLEGAVADAQAGGTTPVCAGQAK